MKIGDIVNLTDIDNMVGLVENVTVHGGMTVYSVRSPYTGTLYTRESEDVKLADEVTVSQVRQDMKLLSPVVAECEIMKVCVDGFVITRGMVNAEMARTAAARKSMIRSASPMMVIGLNASPNMFA